jgi:hypothetical protein
VYSGAYWPAYTRQVPTSTTVVALPVHQDVRRMAPSHEKVKCMWSVCGTDPVYAVQPRSGENSRHILAFQMM